MDNGDVFEFDSVSEARAKANLLKDQDLLEIISH